jgi:hypothetical protein
MDQPSWPTEIDGKIKTCCNGKCLRVGGLRGAFDERKSREIRGGMIGGAHVRFVLCVDCYSKGVDLRHSKRSGSSSIAEPNPFSHLNAFRIFRIADLFALVILRLKRPITRTSACSAIDMPVILHPHSTH